MTGSPATQKNHLAGIILVIIASACWATSGIFIKLIIQKGGISPVGLAFWRDLFSSLVILVGIMIFRPKLLSVKRKDIPWLIGMGVISIGIFHFFWNKSVVLLGASLTTVLQYNAPIIVTILAKLLFNEPLTLKKILAICLAATGTILLADMLTSTKWSIQPQGLFIVLISSIAFATLSLFGKKLSQDYNAWTILFYIFSFGTITLFIFQLGSPDPWPVGSGIIPLFTGLVVISTIIGFTLYTTALKKLPASIASITATTEIFFVSILAYIFLRERMNFSQVMGAMLIISGVVLVSLPKKNSVGDVTLKVK